MNQTKRSPILNWLMAFVASKPGVWFYKNIVRHLDAPLLRWSKGRINIAVGLPVMLVATIGAKSGEKRTQPLLVTIDSPNLILIASNFGQTHHPSWYYNLRKNPLAEVTYQGQTRTYHAHEASGAERERCWALALNLYAGYANYQSRTARQIPVMVLVPHE
ncbi:MAG TPA: nitroreductase family deazaflavin-dependent oxidoreductase [Anaerolineales bacterium]|nr:nitroreductase family deazaflavin-dependent oxidoreductase [Anaerolineales bacterium]